MMGGGGGFPGAAGAGGFPGAAGAGAAAGGVPVDARPSREKYAE